jgi:hypothetical protein
LKFRFPPGLSRAAGHPREFRLRHGGAMLPASRTDFTKFEIINAFDVDFKKTSLDPVLHSRKF